MSRYPRKSNLFGKRQPEWLEDRSMLAANPFMSAALDAVADVQAMVGTRFPAAVDRALEKLAAFSAIETQLGASLTDTNGTATGSVTFTEDIKVGKTETEFTVEISGAAANSVLDVAIDGEVIGELSTDAEGSGRLTLSNRPHGSEQPIPTNFPTSLSAGATITVGTLTGVLGDESGQSMNVQLRAGLTDPDSSASGKVKFRSNSEAGITRLEVQVKGAIPNSTIDVEIDGTVVGQIELNARGRGKIVFSSDPHGPHQLPLPDDLNVTAGSTVTVGSLTGTLEAHGRLA